MDKIKKGDVVVCINSDDCLPYGVARRDIEKGCGYTVEDCRLGVDGHLMLYLKEHENAPFWVGRFVKIKI